MVASFVANELTATANASAGLNGCFTSRWKLSADQRPNSNLHFCSACGSLGNSGFVRVDELEVPHGREARPAEEVEAEALQSRVVLRRPAPQVD